jgi:hypothetical protein
MYMIVFFVLFLTNMFRFLFFTFFVIHYLDLGGLSASRVNCVVVRALVISET